MGNHVFICYARQDQDFVLALAAQLKAREVLVWLDQWDLLPGENYIESIDVVIDGCEKLLLVLSPASESSREVRGEWLSALAKNKPIVPVLARPCNVPRQLLDLHRIDFTGRGPNDESVLAPLVRALGGTPTPAGKDNSDKILSPPPRPQEQAKPPEPPKPPPANDTWARKLAWTIGGIGLLIVFVVWIVPMLSPPKKEQQPNPPVSPSPQPTKTPSVVADSSSKEKDTRVVEKAGKMVEVPAGDFWMGCNEKVDTECEGDEKPGRTVNLPTFMIDKTEVTVADYQKCVDTGPCTPPGTGGACNWGVDGRETHPINCVDWKQATAYCAQTGKRLPTEAEWEKAARGTDGRKYPWGNEWDAKKVNVGSGGTVPVGSYPEGKSPHGALDMAGNVWEWTADWYAADYYKTGPAQNPKGADKGEYRSVRGGSWLPRPRIARASSRRWTDPGDRRGSIGFRCAQ
jgi:formylglycine-generating enzyme